jgi:phytoene dehydrogenase-like protein
MPEIIVIGAGTSGLFSAAFLLKEGYSVEVYEKEKEIGGRAKLWEKNGYKVDYGLHLIRNGKKGFIPSALSKLGEKLDLIPLEHGDMVYWENKDGFRGFFEEIQKNRGLMAEIDKIISSLVKKEISEEDWGRSLHEWVSEVGGSPDLEKFLGFAALEISCPFLERASCGEFFDAMKRRISYGNQPPSYPSGGFWTIHEKLMEIISSLGGKIFLGKEVKKIKVENNEVKGALIDDQTVHAQTVVCAFPCQHLFRVVSEVEPGKMEFLKNIVPTSGISIDYGLSEKITDIKGIMLSRDNFFLMGMVTSNIDDSVAPRGKQLLTFVALTQPGGAKKENLVKMEEIIHKMFPELRSRTEFRRALILPIVDGVELNIHQYRKLRPSPEAAGIHGFFLSGDTLCAEGAGGDLAVTSAMLCVERVKGK